MQHRGLQAKCPSYYVAVVRCFEEPPSRRHGPTRRSCADEQTSPTKPRVGPCVATEAGPEPRAHYYTPRCAHRPAAPICTRHQSGAGRRRSAGGVGPHTHAVPVQISPPNSPAAAPCAPLQRRHPPRPPKLPPLRASPGTAGLRGAPKEQGEPSPVQSSPVQVGLGRHAARPCARSTRPRPARACLGVPWRATRSTCLFINKLA